MVRLNSLSSDVMIWYQSVSRDPVGPPQSFLEVPQTVTPQAIGEKTCSGGVAQLQPMLTVS